VRAGAETHATPLPAGRPPMRVSWLLSSVTRGQFERGAIPALPDEDAFVFGLLAQKRGPQLTAFFPGDRFEFGQGHP
jgi:hypothetical protein